MKTVAGIIILILCSISCGRNDPKDQIQFIGGYWEIESVEMPDGNKKEFTINTTIDFIEVQGDSGVRKKLTPRMDGSFREFPSSEKFRLIIRNDSLLIHYRTPFDDWTETVIKADGDFFIVKNKDQKKYSYKRYEKLMIDD